MFLQLGNWGNLSASVDPEEREFVEEKVVESANQLNQVMESVLLPAQWNELKQIGNQYLIYRYGVKAVIEHLPQFVRRVGESIH